MPPTPTCGGFISRYIIAILVLASALCVMPVARADDLVLEVIPLQHRSADELLPLIRDFLAKDGVIKAADAKLIIRTHPANLKELRSLIAKLDIPLRRLLITVKQLSGEAARQAGATVKDHAAESGVRVWQTETRDDADRVQQVEVLENGEASIDMGRQIPISDFAVTQSQSGTLMEQKTRYIGATTGFYARPRLNGDTVSIDIMPYQTTQSGTASPPEFNTQALHTTVSGKLGEWIIIGASSTNTVEQNDNAMEYSTAQRGELDRRILLRVSVAP